MLRYLIAAGCAATVLLSAGHALLAERARPVPAIGKTTIVADGCTLTNRDGRLNVTLENNVRMTGVQNGQPMTLRCARLLATGVQNGLQQAQAVDPAFTTVLPLRENGKIVKYRLEVFGASLVIDNKNKRVTVEGEAAERAKLTLVPLDGQAGSRAELLANRIACDLTAASQAATTPRTAFFEATGNAALSASVANGTNATAMKIAARAARIIGQLEPSQGGVAQVFHFERGAGADAQRPHLDLTSLAPQQALRLDADRVSLTPSALALASATSGVASEAPVPAITATGSVQFSGSLQQKDGSVTMSGGGSDVAYRMEKSLATDRVYDRFLLVRATTGRAKLTMTQGDDGDPLTLAAPVILTNLDAEKSVTDSSEARAEAKMRGGKP